MLADAALVSKKFTKMKNYSNRVMSTLNKRLVSQGHPGSRWGVREFSNDPLTLKLYFMYYFFSATAKKPKQTFSVVFDSSYCYGFDAQRDYLFLKENLEKVAENFQKKGFKTKIQAIKISSNPKYKFTISTRENFR